MSDTCCWAEGLLFVCLDWLAVCLSLPKSSCLFVSASTSDSLCQSDSLTDPWCLTGAHLGPHIFAPVYSLSSLLKHQQCCINAPWQPHHASIDLCLVWHFSRIPNPVLPVSPPPSKPQAGTHLLCVCVCTCLPLWLWISLSVYNWSVVIHSSDLQTMGSSSPVGNSMTIVGLWEGCMLSFFSE